MSALAPGHALDGGAATVPRWVEDDFRAYRRAGWYHSFDVYDTIRKGPAGQPGAELDWAYIEKPAEAFGEGPGREGMAAAVRGLSSGMGPR